MAWLMTVDGILMPSLIPIDHIPVDHPDWIMQVRARRKIDLERLVERFIPEGQCSEIHTTPGMDYNFRLYCSKETFAQAAYGIVLDVDYIKFKPQCEIRHPGPDGKLLHSVYNSIWGTVTRLGAPYVGDGTGDISQYTTWGAHATDEQVTKPSTKKNSQAEKVWHLLSRFDNGELTQEECLQEVAKYPEDVWSTVATPVEAMMIRRVVSDNKQNRDHKGRFIRGRRKSKV